MTLTHDHELNIGYLQLEDTSNATVTTIRVGDDIAIDVEEDGAIHGIEFLNANTQLKNCAPLDTLSYFEPMEPHEIVAISIMFVFMCLGTFFGYLFDRKHNGNGNTSI